MLRLYLLRHGKSSWDKAPGAKPLADHLRPLAPRGEAAIPLIGAYMHEHAFNPELIICSSAKRTRQTCALILSALDHDYTIKVCEELYQFSFKAYLSVLAKMADGYNSVMLIAHNPATGELAKLLAHEQIRAHSGLRANYPTGALTVFDIPGNDWHSFDYDETKLIDFVLPRKLAAKQRN